MAGYVPYPVIFLSHGKIEAPHVVATLTAQLILWASLFSDLTFRFYLHQTLPNYLASNEVISTKTVVLLTIVYFTTGKYYSKHVQGQIYLLLTDGSSVKCVAIYKTFFSP